MATFNSLYELGEIEYETFLEVKEVMLLVFLALLSMVVNEVNELVSPLVERFSKPEVLNWVLLTISVVVVGGMAFTSLTSSAENLRLRDIAVLTILFTGLAIYPLLRRSTVVEGGGKRLQSYLDGFGSSEEVDEL